MGRIARFAGGGARAACRRVGPRGVDGAGRSAGGDCRARRLPDRRDVPRLPAVRRMGRAVARDRRERRRTFAARTAGRRRRRTCRRGDARCRAARHATPFRRCLGRATRALHRRRRGPRRRLGDAGRAGHRRSPGRCGAHRGRGGRIRGAREPVVARALAIDVRAARPVRPSTRSGRRALRRGRRDRRRTRHSRARCRRRGDARPPRARPARHRIGAGAARALRCAGRGRRADVVRDRAPAALAGAAHRRTLRRGPRGGPPRRGLCRPRGRARRRVRADARARRLLPCRGGRLRRGRRVPERGLRSRGAGAEAAGAAAGRHRRSPRDASGQRAPREARARDRLHPQPRVHRLLLARAAGRRAAVRRCARGRHRRRLRPRHRPRPRPGAAAARAARVAVEMHDPRTGRLRRRRRRGECARPARRAGQAARTAATHRCRRRPAGRRRPDRRRVVARRRARRAR